MTTNNFFSPETSKLLQEKGCKRTALHDLPKGEWLNIQQVSRNGNQDLFCIWDILDKQNAILVFGEEEYIQSMKNKKKEKITISCVEWEFHIHHLLDLYNSGGDWQGYVKGFLTKDV